MIRGFLARGFAVFVMGVIVCAFPLHSVSAKFLLRATDLISTSEASARVTHMMEFTANQAVPASGYILIVPEDNAFVLDAGYSFSDMELWVSSGGGPYVARTLAATPNGAADGVVFDPPSGFIQITLNSTTGLSASDRIRFVLNENATRPLNPASIGSYRIRFETQDAIQNQIDNGSAMISIVPKVTITVLAASTAPVEANGLPAGEVAANNPSIEITFITNKSATCRYSLTPSVPFNAMTNNFSSSGGTIFYTTIGGHLNGGSYAYYIRCMDGFGNMNTDDFIISFTIAPDPISNTSIASGGNSGRGGIGDVPNGSDVLFLADATLSGFAPPQSTVTILKDGSVAKTISVLADGSFSGTVKDLERGTYTFNAYATDAEGRKTSSYSATLTLDSGTQNKISNIVLSPTVELSPSAAGLGENVRIFGTSIPSVGVEVYVTRKDGVSGIKDVIILNATSTAPGAGQAGGAWNVTVDGKKLVKGTYAVQARARISTQAVSNMSKLAILTVGQAKGDNSNRSDLNKDGKVNLVDFSILLSFWATNDDVADINQDGTVNIADFSIMLFNWTG